MRESEITIRRRWGLRGQLVRRVGTKHFGLQESQIQVSVQQCRTERVNVALDEGARVSSLLGLLHRMPP